MDDVGFHALSARNSVEVIKLLEAYADLAVLLFTDVEMPGGPDGFELARTTAISTISRGRRATRGPSTQI